MVHRFIIEKDKFGYAGGYLIKKKSWLIPPLYQTRTMTKNEFFASLTRYGEDVLSRENAYFNSLQHAKEALHRYAQINGLTEIIVKVCEN